MVGGAGEDSFRFSSALGGGNVDRIADFDVANDLILLDSRIFTTAGSGPVLSFGAFHSSTAGTAQDASDRIIYDIDSGYLSYDADGNGAGAAVRFAHVSANLALTADDFIII